MANKITLGIMDDESGEIICTGRYCVYRIVVLCTGEVAYVGSSNNFLRRSDEHISGTQGRRRHTLHNKKKMYMYLRHRPFIVEPMWLYDTEKEMLSAEKDMIAELRPRFNAIKTPSKAAPKKRCNSRIRYRTKRLVKELEANELDVSDRTKQLVNELDVSDRTKQLVKALEEGA